MPACPPQRVLYIDDDRDFALLFKRVLEYLGHSVAIFHDPQEALAALGSAPLQWSAVITDYNLPGMNGLQVARALERRFAHVRCQVISGMVTRAMAEEAATGGTAAPLPRPSSVREFDQLVRRASAGAAAGPRRAGPVARPPTQGGVHERSHPR